MQVDGLLDGNHDGVIGKGRVLVVLVRAGHARSLPDLRALGKALPNSQPLRGGLDDDSFHDMISVLWVDLLASLGRRAAR